MTATASDFTFDPFKPGLRDQLPQVLAELRERFPVYRTSSDIWVVSRFDDVKAVQSEPAAVLIATQSLRGIRAAR